MGAAGLPAPKVAPTASSARSPAIALGGRRHQHSCLPTAAPYPTLACHARDGARLARAGARLREAELPEPEPGPGQLRLRVEACGVCRTDLHVARRRAPRPEAAARARPPDRRGRGRGRRRASSVRGRRARGRAVARLDLRRVPLLPERAARTSATAPASPATSSTAATRRRPSPTRASASRSRPATPPLQAAPLLCAGLIGYRALRLAGDAERLGLYGFGASAHVVAQVARWQGRRVFAFTREGDAEGQEFARSLGAEWAGASGRARRPSRSRRRSSSRRQASWSRSRCARSRRAASVVCAGIHMSDIPAFPYELLWGERVVRSVANLTRAGRRGVPRARAARAGADAASSRSRSRSANEALERLRAGSIRGAAVLAVDAG